MIVNGFRLAAAMNIGGVLLFSLGLTNERLIGLSPVVFSRFGLACIILWGLAYLAAGPHHERLPLLAGVFALEKLLYVGTWLLWMREHGGQLPALFSESPLTATFYAIYGPNDLLFGAFFTYVAFRAARRQHTPK
jgi:hypothetical protein